jgi:hypothetical protein
LGGERVTLFGLFFSGNPNINGAFHVYLRVAPYWVSTDYDRKEKKRLLSEVVQKIKVNSLEEVHLFLALPQRINSLGLTVKHGAEGLRNTQKAICQLTYRLSDYYNSNHKSI